MNFSYTVTFQVIKDMNEPFLTLVFDFKSFISENVIGETLNLKNLDALHKKSVCSLSLLFKTS